MLKESDLLRVIQKTITAMRSASNLDDCLQIVAHGLCEAGWRQVSLALYDEDLMVSQPPDVNRWLSGYEHSALQLFIHAGPKRLLKLDPYRLGIGYFFPRPDTDASTPGTETTSSGTAWMDGDALFVPIWLSTDKVGGLISLSQPDDQQRPTETDLLPLDMLLNYLASVVENYRLKNALNESTAKSHNQIEELVMMQRVDQELSATLNFENVMMLTMDWAMRRTGATAGMLNMVTPDSLGLVPVAALGYPLEVLAEHTTSPLPMDRGIVGRAARTKEIQIVPSVQDDPDYVPLLGNIVAEIAIPMEMRGRLLGVLNLETEDSSSFEEIDLGFIERLASRAAVALDNARLYREAEQRADEMGALYAASRAISSSLERGEVLINSAQALAAVLGVSGILLADYSTSPHRLTVSAAYRLGTARNAPDLLPIVGEFFEIDQIPEFASALKSQRGASIQTTSISLSAPMRAQLEARRIRSMLMVPLVVQNQVLGAAILVEGRRDRLFASDEILLAEALTSQSASALRQAKLYEDVRELEKLKSEMIRMASHDLRNPLGNAMGYLELLLMGIGNTLTPTQWEFVGNIRRSANAMKSLIEDLLTLERVESERQVSWVEVNLSQLVYDVSEAQKDSAALKGHSMTAHIDDMEWWVRGNTTQLRQAITNLVGNAIKYTPDNGQIHIRLRRENDRLRFEVEDNGYGISPEKQARLFQRFYRAHEPGTDHISGTGLGLSLVKAVIERHSGEVWVKSTPGNGSTFGFWLPAIVPTTNSDSTAEANPAVVQQQP